MRLIVPPVISSLDSSAFLTCNVMASPVPSVYWTLCQTEEDCTTLTGNVRPSPPSSRISFTSKLSASDYLHLLPGGQGQVTCSGSNHLGEVSANSLVTLVDYLPAVPAVITWCLCFTCSDCQGSPQVEGNATHTAYSSQMFKAECSTFGPTDQGWILPPSLNRKITLTSSSTNRSHKHLLLIDQLPAGQFNLHCNGLSLLLDVRGEIHLLFYYYKL